MMRSIVSIPIDMLGPRGCDANHANAEGNGGHNNQAFI
jgi:hypothetical protein